VEVVGSVDDALKAFGVMSDEFIKNRLGNQQFGAAPLKDSRRRFLGQP
jgi:hypothetical protein